ncbi:hypothetical protein [Nocardioides euryhalodurans]|uniref:WD40 repeat domain-containing protein n=1 Tax=Nocardioides euryhalodurans TaxID=2518370 RepID=A0A4P7GKQ7_9ACTN|nr:hypothetical protein [Nocardioides euryhalodurans]QBR92636.1 hypothetical protein EXE57_10375 [Nocardioides euryhalodurans]
MSVDQDLGAVLREVAEAHAAPEPDLAAITAGGRRRRRTRDVRRGVVALSCVALLAAVPLTLDLGWPGAERPPVISPRPDETSVTDLPMGDPPAIPHCDGADRIVGAGAPIEARCDVMLHRGGSTLHYAPDGLARLVDGERLPLGGGFPSYWFPALSVDGHYAAWVADAPGRGDAGTLHVVDLEDGSRVAEQPFPTSEVWVPGIDDLGRVYVATFETSKVWTYDIRSRRTVPVTDLPGVLPVRVRFVTADGIGVRGTGASTSVVGTVTADGDLTQRRQVDLDASTFSPDRSLVAHEEEGRFVVTPVGGGESVELDLPTEGSATWLPTWEDQRHLLFQFDPRSDVATVSLTYGVDAPARRTWLLRCDATDGSCEVALRPGWAAGLDVPVYR